MCGSAIVENICDCGVWEEISSGHPIKAALLEFHEMKQIIFTTDIPDLGVAAIFFRGDYKDCKEIEDFILKMKRRPFYKEENE